MRGGYKWPLNSSRFTWRDRAALSAFFLQPQNRWTQGEQVVSYEKAMADYIGCPFTVFTSSGSTANTLLAMHARDSGESSRNVIVLPAVTWQTSCAPWMREGFTPQFIDINQQDLSMDLKALERYLVCNAGKVACVFLTSLLGFVPNIPAIGNLAEEFGVRVMLDNCESLSSSYAGLNVSASFTSTLSTYFAHNVQSVEGGFVCTSDERLYEYCLMARNHGMARSVPVESRSQYENGDVDPRFDFFCLGSNFRNSDINARIGLLDFARVNEYAAERMNAYSRFAELLDPTRYLLPERRKYCEDVPFALPILPWAEQKTRFVIELCNDLGIESRPIISGNLLRHTAYKRFSSSTERFPVADMVSDGIYVGLGGKIDYRLLETLADELNGI